MPSLSIFILGAGRPARGTKPSALKEISHHMRALDWQLASFAGLDQPNIHYLGGYQAQEIIDRYPQLHYTIIPDWQTHSVTHTLLNAPPHNQATMMCYADTIFRNTLIEDMADAEGADIFIACDSLWRSRYTERSVKHPNAELIKLNQNIPLFDGQPLVDTDPNIHELTGFIKFAPNVMAYLRTQSEHALGHSIPAVLQSLHRAGFSIRNIDAANQWAEFDEPKDIAQFVLGTKAQTLERLAPCIEHAIIGHQVNFTVQDWQADPEQCIKHIQSRFPAQALVVRSSALSEDCWQQSNAGSYKSLLGIDSRANQALTEAINIVAQSYQRGKPDAQDQILIQAHVIDIASSGVVFTRALDTGAPYYRINFDDCSQSTDSVTGGESSDLRTILIYRSDLKSISQIAPELEALMRAVVALETLLGYDQLDIEFAIDQSAQVHIFQVRPLTVDHANFEVEDSEFDTTLQAAKNQFLRLQAPSPFIQGDQTYFSIMSDWNPAEIIGRRPKPLALSLYHSLITETIWAQQRAEFGYRDVRPNPLIVAFAGQPYVDIRASLNSFIPASVCDATAKRLVNAYLKRLKAHPSAHDKLEFEIAQTIWTPAFRREAQSRLIPLGINAETIDELEAALLGLTRDALTRLDTDIASIQDLNTRHTQILAANLNPLDTALMLLNDCRRFGTGAFAHAARAGFIANIFLKSFVDEGIISESDKANFQQSIHTIVSEFEADTGLFQTGKINLADFLKCYGHLRPGTYDITALAYWEAPEHYLDASDKHSQANIQTEFQFTDAAKHAMATALEPLNRSLHIDAFINYLSQAIQARERVKFDFTRNLSVALDQLVTYGKAIGIQREDLAYLSLEDFEALRNGMLTLDQLTKLIALRQSQYTITQMIELPQLIFSQDDFVCFERATNQPNFIGNAQVQSQLIVWETRQSQDLSGCVIMIRQADPGYDWLFSKKISGLITQYGGANSHMAIRAAELGIPAAIGVGDAVYEQLSQARRVDLDCAGQQIKRLS